MVTATATAAPTTEDLNGMLSQPTPSLISANAITQGLATKLGLPFGIAPQAFVDYCKTRRMFVGTVFAGGEYMVNLNEITDEFISDFVKALVESVLVKPYQEKAVEAIASLRGTAATTDSGPEDDTEIVAPKTQAKMKPWKLGKEGAKIRDTVVNLFATNDPAGDKGFMESLQSQDERATALVNKVVEKLYGNSTRSRNSLLKEITNYINELKASGEGATTGAATTETPAKTKPERTRTRKPKADAAA